jgi:hypothetical protein
MKQILHIFAKDARHFLPEILVSLAITATFAWIYPNQWLHSRSVHAVAGGSPFFIPQELTLLATLLALLVPVSWWLLISRVIHAETLVGDCQFWLTRPYEWKKLLTAKLLFLACFLYLPIFLAQCFLLMQAGFSPLAYLPGLFFNLLLITGLLVLPLFSIAAVTSSFARMTLTIVAALFCFIGLAALSSAFIHTSISDPLPDRVTLPLLLCGGIAVVVLQYLTRRTWLARLLLVLLVGLLWASGAVISDDALIHRAYPPANNTQPPSLQSALAEDLLHQPTAYIARSAKRVGITLPLQISGIADGYVWMPDNVKISIEGPHGSVWNLPWQAMYNSHYFPGGQDFITRFEMSRAIFDQIKSAPVTLHLTFAWTQLRSGQVQRIAIPTHDFVVPGFGVCAPALDWTAPTQITEIACRTALRQPPLTYVDTRWSEDPCPSPAAPSTTGIEGSGWTGSLNTAPAEFSLSSVSATQLPLSNNWNSESNRPTKPRHLCPGTPLTFTEYKVVQRTQSDISIPNFRFPTYKAPNISDASFGVQISPR